VAAVYTQQPHIRTPQQVIENLFNTVPGPPQAQKEPPLPPIRPEYKRVWASLNKGKAGVIDQVVEDMARRDPLKNKDWVMLTDGERALQKQVQARLEDVPLVLDFQHVLEKLWLAAYAFHDEGSPG